MLPQFSKSMFFETQHILVRPPWIARRRLGQVLPWEEPLHHQMLLSSLMLLCFWKIFDTRRFAFGSLSCLQTRANVRCSFLQRSGRRSQKWSRRTAHPACENSSPHFSSNRCYRYTRIITARSTACIARSNNNHHDDDASQKCCSLCRGFNCVLCNISKRSSNAKSNSTLNGPHPVGSFCGPCLLK